MASNSAKLKRWEMKYISASMIRIRLGAITALNRRIMSGPRMATSAARTMASKAPAVTSQPSPSGWPCCCTRVSRLSSARPHISPSTASQPMVSTTTDST
ncbi:hypothetical protein WMF93_14780 [Pseudomonas alkylphenolica]